MSKNAPIKLTEPERTTIVNALTLAARQYEIDAERASELALHGMTIFEPAEAPLSSSDSMQPTLENCATRSHFYGSTLSFERGARHQQAFYLLAHRNCSQFITYGNCRRRCGNIHPRGKSARCANCWRGIRRSSQSPALRYSEETA